MITPNLVIDCSVIIKWLSQDNENLLEVADKILRDAQKDKIVLITPELTKYEIGNVLLFGKHLSLEQAKIILAKFYNLPVLFVAESEYLANKTYQIAKDANITYYDASFMALALQENAILVTDNFKHQGKNPDIKVVSLKDY